MRIYHLHALFLLDFSLAYQIMKRRAYFKSTFFFLLTLYNPGK